MTYRDDTIQNDITKYNFSFFTLCLILCGTLRLCAFAGNSCDIGSSINAPASSNTSTEIVPHPDNTSKYRKCYLGVCMVFQNEAPYLKEWIEYHRLVGAGHFYLYNNLSTDNYLEILEPYIKEGLVELFEFPETYFRIVQKTLYSHALEIAKDNNFWLALIDSDEFICPIKKNKLEPVLKEYEYAGALNVFWQSFGTSDVRALKPGELLVEKLTRKWPENWCMNSLTKPIVQPKYTVKSLDPHRCEVMPGLPNIYPDHIAVPYEYPNNILPIDVIRINHYCCRTEDYFYNIKLPRLKRRNADPVDVKEYLREGNSIKDKSMKRFIPELKKLLD